MPLPLADEEGITPLVVRKSAIAGLGLFAAGPGKPAALEYKVAARGSGMGVCDDEAWRRVRDGDAVRLGLRSGLAMR